MFYYLIVKLGLHVAKWSKVSGHSDLFDVKVL